ncbi:hypothetical protein B9Z19DRAFT_1124343 [Tuber borchii]|uniref:Uncharacterized protein n=1 Tax=Tuber borchii TaxID=42251 RepID=A0A2T6ZWZ0_TUBBO|nr:hypothetical protein B9Z19DRAFT_1124343 [Tuber borchii]
MNIDTSTSVQKAAGKFNLHNISQELAYRARIVKRISQTTAVSAILSYCCDEKLRCSSFVSPPDVALLNRLGSEESDADFEGEAEDGMNEAQTI